MAHFHSNALIGAGGQGGGAVDAQIERSLRFNSGDSAYLNKTLSSGNRKKWTYSAWVKRTQFNQHAPILAVNSSEPRNYIRFTDDHLHVGGADGDATGSYFEVRTSGVFRDPSAWYHIVVVMDSDQATAADRTKIYVNGVLNVESTSSGYLDQGQQTQFNSADPHYIGWMGSGSNYFNGYLADVYFIDGSALDPTSFGAYDDNGVWQAAGYSGSYGTNGFHLLDFANESTVGHDSSGNNNDFTANNFTTTAPTVYSSNGSITNNDGRTDQVGSFAAVFNGTANAQASDAYGFLNGSFDFTWNLSTAISYSNSVEVWTGFGSGSVYLNGGSAVSSNNNNWTTLVNGSSGTITSIRFTQGSSGGWWSAVRVDGTHLVNGNPANLDVLYDVPQNRDQSDTGAGGEVSGNYCTWNPLSPNLTSTFSQGNLTVATNSSNTTHVAGTIAFPTSGKWYWEVTRDSGSYEMFGVIGVNNTFETSTYLNQYSESYVMYSQTGALLGNNSGSSTGSGATFGNGDVMAVALDLDNQQLRFYKNGSQLGGFNSVTTSEQLILAVSDHDGSSSTFTLNTGQRAFAYAAPSGYKALCTANLPTPTVADGSLYFDTKLYNGNGGTNAITGFEFSPDFVWLKRRSSAKDHSQFDSVRGVYLQLFSNYNNAEASKTSSLTSFDSNGFTLGSSNRQNENGYTNVAWAWDAGSSTVSNTDGSQTTSVRANATAGFSIVKGANMTSSQKTFGHGLSAAPEMIIGKRLGASEDWNVYHKDLTSNKMLTLNTTDGEENSNFVGTPTSSVFTYYPNADSYIFYCFAPVAGYSAVSSYTSTGSTNFIYTGFRVAFLMVKKVTNSADSSYEGWFMVDSTRGDGNIVNESLFANSSQVEGKRGNGGTPTDSDFGVDLLSNGFCFKNNATEYNRSDSSTYVYYAVAENPFRANGGLAR